MIEVDVKIPPDLERKLQPERIVAVLRASTFAVGQLVQGELQKSTPPAHKPVKWASARSRRYYFAMRRKMGLPMRYTRNSDPMSQRLQRSWTVKHQGTTDAVVGAKATYARYVQSERYQSAQHRATGWVTDTQAVSTVQKSGGVERIVLMAVKKELGL